MNAAAVGFGAPTWENMFVGVARYVLQIPAARSLKQRRHVIKSCKDRLRARLPVSVAEVGDLGRLQVATLGVAVIAGEAARCDQILASTTRMMNGLPEAILADVRTEVISFGEGGSGVRFGIDAGGDTRLTEPIADRAFDWQDAESDDDVDDDVDEEGGHGR